MRRAGPARVLVLSRLVALATILTLALAALGTAPVIADEIIVSNATQLELQEAGLSPVYPVPVNSQSPNTQPEPENCPPVDKAPLEVETVEAQPVQHHGRTPPNSLHLDKEATDNNATTASENVPTRLDTISTESRPPRVTAETSVQQQPLAPANQAGSQNSNCPTTGGTGNVGGDPASTASSPSDSSGQPTTQTQSPVYQCGESYELTEPGTYYCLDFRKIWLNADDRYTSPPSGASVRLDISLNGQSLGSLQCTQTGCTQLFVFLANFDPDGAVFFITENGLPQGWRLHPDYQDGATFAELLDPPGVQPPVACLTSIWRDYPDRSVTQCVLQIANQAVSSPGDGTDDTSGGQGGGTSGGQGGTGGGQGGNPGGTGGGQGDSGTGGTGGGQDPGDPGGSTGGGASTAPSTPAVPASEAASPSTDAQPVESSDVPTTQQPASEVLPASSAPSTAPPIPQVLPRTGQPQTPSALLVLAGIALGLIGSGVTLLRRHTRTR